MMPLRSSLPYFSFLLFLACGPNDDDASKPRCPEADALRLGDVIELPEGGDITITAVNDDLCPCDAVCVWAGEVTIELRDNLGNTGRLGGFAGVDRNTRTDTLGSTIVQLDTIYTPLPCGGSVAARDICFALSVR